MVMESRPVVDYPVKGEIISSERYTVRVSAPEGARKVELMIGRGAWRACRPGAGYWWCDWTGYASGEQRIVARAEGPDGRCITSDSREFFTALAGAAAAPRAHYKPLTYRSLFTADPTRVRLRARFHPWRSGVRALVSA